MAKRLGNAITTAHYEGQYRGLYIDNFKFKLLNNILFYREVISCTRRSDSAESDSARLGKVSV